MSDTPSDWFADWLDQHRVNNPHNAWASFEAPGKARVYLGWIAAFEELGVSRLEADAASLKLQRSGECWPVDHLARLLAILGPVVRGRREAAEMARRRRESAEWALARAAHRGHREAFWELPQAERAARLASARARYPSLAGLPGLVERLAVDEWLGRAMPAVEAVGAAPGHAEAPGPAPDGPDDDDPLTPAQMAFIASLSPGQRARLDAVSAARRREVLAPFADDFDPRLFEVLAAELRPAAEATLEPATTG